MGTDFDRTKYFTRNATGSRSVEGGEGKIQHNDTWASESLENCQNQCVIDHGGDCAGVEFKNPGQYGGDICRTFKKITEAPVYTGGASWDVSIRKTWGQTLKDKYPVSGYYEEHVNDDSSQSLDNCKEQCTKDHGSNCAGIEFKTNTISDRICRTYDETIGEIKNYGGWDVVLFKNRDTNYFSTIPIEDKYCDWYTGGTRTCQPRLNNGEETGGVQLAHLCSGMTTDETAYSGKCKSKFTCGTKCAENTPCPSGSHEADWQCPNFNNGDFCQSNYGTFRCDQCVFNPSQKRWVNVENGYTEGSCGETTDHCPGYRCDGVRDSTGNADDERAGTICNGDYRCDTCWFTGLRRWVRISDGHTCVDCNGNDLNSGGGGKDK